MTMPKGPENDPRQSYEDRVREEMIRGSGSDRDSERRYYQTDPSFQELVQTLRRLGEGKGEQKPDEPKSPERGEIGEHLDQVMQKMLYVTDELLDGRLLRFKNAVPYDVRSLEMFFDGLRDGIRLAREEEWNTPETKAWLERLDVDMEWGRNNSLLLQGMSGVVDKMFDGDLMLNWVRERFREDPVQTVYQRTFSAGKNGDGEEILGLVVAPESKPLLGERAENGLRERALKFQDDAAWARVAVAAAAQFDPDNPADPDALKPNQTPAERIFFQTILRQRKKSADGWVEYRDKSGNLQRVPERMVNWNSMSSVDKYKRRYIATLQAVLLTGARDKLTKLQREEDGIKTYDQEEMGKLVEEVERKRDEILKAFFSDKKDLNIHLAGVVVKSGIVFDWGHMCSGPMSWAWTYKPLYAEGDVKKGKIIGWEKKPTAGPTTTATDSNTPHYWWWNFLSTMNKGWPSGIFPRVSKEYLAQALENSPNWKPEFLGKVFKNQEAVHVAWKALWENKSEWDPRALQWLQAKMVWAWETSYGVIPIFMPREFASINFLETITLAEEEGSCSFQLDPRSGAVRPDNPSVWDQIRAGEDMSKIRWENMGDQSFYRWLITIGQFFRFYSVFKEPGGDQAVELFGKEMPLDPDNLEVIMKRSELGTRDERIPGPVMIMSVAPLLVALKLAGSRKIFGARGEDNKHRSAWIEDVAKWVTAFQGMPEERSGYKNYGKSLAKLLEFYTTIFADLGNRMGKSEKLAADDNYKRLQARLERVGASVSDRTVVYGEVKGAR